ncbi:putative metalloprotease CJM1_0395 family protein [Marichromatium gracile]|uniref:putative metalloprotease CJM1_0395 family protein n=1 Tax=Marichromatium gracile TaxID=1048 RepID=UPI0009ED5570|nr:putative metalloprotease CJM1_0395 family protein [Marichromatium gracile]
MEIHSGVGASLRPSPAPVADSSGGATRQQETASTAGRESGENAQPRPAEQPEQTPTPEELRLVEQLRQRDREVRMHEQAHVAAGGRYVTGGPSYTYQTGPDGRQYAIGGEVQIDTSKEADPAATLDKAEAVLRAALAPAEPSGQDQRVAAQARAMQIEAQREMRVLEQADQEMRRMDGEASAARADANAQDANAAGMQGPGAERDRLERRIAGFFAPARSAEQINQFA